MTEFQVKVVKYIRAFFIDDDYFLSHMQNYLEYYSKRGHGCQPPR
jgi:hypothetical protein